MSAGGGLSNSKLALANTNPEDVISGKKFYSGDKTLKTGTLVDLGHEPVAKGGVLYNGSLYFYVGENGGQRRWALTRGVSMPQSQVASLIGLTAGKIYTGNTILGIAGTGGSSYSASSGDKTTTGGQQEMRRDEGNRLAYANTYMKISATVTGRKVVVNGYAHFHVTNNGTSGIVGDGDYSKCWLYFEVPF